MKQLTDEEIAKKLDGINEGELRLWKYPATSDLYFGLKAYSPSKFLALCRKVVKQVEGEKFSIKEIEKYIQGNLLISMADGQEDSKHFKQYNQAVRHIWGELADKEDGIAVVTARNRK